jgi:hypothetical protein
MSENATFGGVEHVSISGNARLPTGVMLKVALRVSDSWSTRSPASSDWRHYAPRS